MLAPPPQSAAVVAISSAQMLNAGERLVQAGRWADAEQVYRALFHDPDAEVGLEAMFRVAGLKEQEHDRKGAIALLEQLLALKPTAARPRLELARLLALAGDEAGARRELRRANADGLPADVAGVVDRFESALRSNALLGGSIGVSLAPDSNLNHSTRGSINTVVGPLAPDADARARSGIGIAVDAQGYARSSHAPVAMLVRASTQSSLYRRRHFDDVIGTIAVGPEIRAQSGRWQPAIFYGMRWYGGGIYSRTAGVSLDLLRPIGKQAQVEVATSAGYSRYPRATGQDGWLIASTVNYDRAITGRLSGRLTASVGRQDARQAAYAYWTGGGGGLLAYDLGRVTLFGSGSLSRLVADDRIQLFPSSRRDLFASWSGGIIASNRSWFGAKPLLKASRIVNRSTVDLYGFRETRVEAGLTKDF